VATNKVERFILYTLYMSGANVTCRQQSTYTTNQKFVRHHCSDRS